MRHTITTLPLSLTLAAIFAATACEADDDADDDAGAAADTDGAASDGQADDGYGDGPDVDLDALYACEENALVEFRPLSGPGWSSLDGLTDDGQDTYIVHATQIYNIPEKMGQFIELSQAVMEHADASPALVGFAVAGDMECNVSRTLGVWKDEVGIYQFTGSGAHLEAMDQAGELSYSGRVTHWTMTREELLEGIDWDTAREHLKDVPPSDIYDY